MDFPAFASDPVTPPPGSDFFPYVNLIHSLSDFGLMQINPTRSKQ